MVYDAMCNDLVPVMGNMSIVMLLVILLLIVGQYCACCIRRNTQGKTKKQIDEESYKQDNQKN